MNRSFPRRSTALAVAASVVLSSGCSAFNDGVADGLEKDVNKDYSWAKELYEFPVGLIGFPLLVALSPFLYWIPESNGEFGYALGRAYGRDFLYIDPTRNY